MRKHPFRIGVEKGAKREDLAKLRSPDAEIFASMLTRAIHGAAEVLTILGHTARIAEPIQHLIDTEVDLGTTNGGYLLKARLNVNLPGIDREVAHALVDGAHQECPYSKATSGNISVVTNLLKTTTAAHVA